MCMDNEIADRPIAVGDLVCIVGACCDPKNVVGFVERVVGLRSTKTNCGGCGQSYFGVHAWFEGGNHWGFPAVWLKRIPPLDELESASTDEPMKEPA